LCCPRSDLDRFSEQKRHKLIPEKDLIICEVVVAGDVPHAIVSVGGVPRSQETGPEGLVRVRSSRTFSGKPPVTFILLHFEEWKRMTGWERINGQLRQTQ
jgi:hypothetical protein